MKYIYVLSFVLIFKLRFADQQLNCNDWDSYKDEKCYKIIKKLKSFEDANAECFDLEQSNLVSIRSQEEQDFLFYLLIEIHKIVDNVWIGIKHSTNSYKWTDSSPLEYTNWANGFPVNNSGYDCVQMYAMQPYNGKWFNVMCTTTNIVVCEKEQKWLVSYLQKSVIYLKETVNTLNISLWNTSEELDKSNKELEITKSELMSTNNELHETKIGLEKTIAEMSIVKRELQYLNPCKSYNDSIECRVFVNYLTNNRQAIAIPKKANEQSATHRNAELLCNKYNMSSVSIKSAEKQKFLSETYASFRNKAIWTSGFKDGLGVWRWGDGSQFNYTNWLTCEPNNLGGNENCVQINTYSQWNWNDNSCSSNNFVMCESDILI